jgi:AAA+ ATPase superfamily predicted ATPase
VIINREAEQARLTAAWVEAQQGRPQLVVLWGRRRVGKTYLLASFAEDKPTVFFAATHEAQAIELQRLAERTREALGDEVIDLAGGSFVDWERALRFFAALAQQRPVLLVLDEVPYLARSTPGFASIVQAVWDHIRPGTRLMIVLTGSAMNTMDKILSGPLHERPTLKWRMDPLTPLEARAFLPDMEPMAFVEAYAACGGYPLHLLSWSKTSSTQENLLRLAGQPAAVLLEAASSILGEEIRDDGYRRVLGALGRGATRYSELASQAGQRIEHALDALVRAGFVKRSLPLGAPKAANPQYAIDDTYLAFWFTVLAADAELIEGGQGSAVLNRAGERWKRHVAATYEEAARLHAAQMVRDGRLPPDLVVGRWWTTSGEQREVDILGLRGNRTALLGEVKWQRRPVGQPELRALYRSLAHVPDPVDNPTFLLYGRVAEDEQVAAESNVMFLDAADVFPRLPT